MTVEPAPHAGDDLACPPGMHGSVRDLTKAWLLSYNSPNTRDAYRREIERWFCFCAEIGLDPLQARKSHGDVYQQWLELQAGRPIPPQTMNLRISAVSSWYDYLFGEDVIDANRFKGTRRPKVNRRRSETAGLTRAEARDVLYAADHDHGRERLRTAALIRLLMETGVRVTEGLAAQLPDLGHERGHRTLRIVGKGDKPQTRKIPPAAAHAIDAYVTHRAERAGITVEELTGPLFVSASGRRLDRKDVYDLVERIGRQAGITGLHPHQLRRTFATLAEEAGVDPEARRDLAVRLDSPTVGGVMLLPAVPASGAGSSRQHQESGA
ncbi:tyrosine-type recombinase/integrase [Nonomuraea sp. NPDC049714]|uniref:tyrosine-type recombinase/integrase n=1 Tax=Nonomuraea sp. NPDC049714 TaxID=3364357 RepID=UPI0037AD4AE7